MLSLLKGASKLADGFLQISHKSVKITHSFKVKNGLIFFPHFQNIKDANAKYFVGFAQGRDKDKTVPEP